jgi:hypothetical protein
MPQVPQYLDFIKLVGTFVFTFCAFKWVNYINKRINRSIAWEERRIKEIKAYNDDE